MGDFLLALTLAVWTAVAITVAKLSVPEMIASALVFTGFWLLASQKNVVPGSRAFGPLKKI